ncbi:peptidoglycan DD-metalloendopeptidase family protein [Pseudoalteromonas sp. T1lg65]|uniref:M23 family metallopeptidase n=1 Tax=Pseudoalteromonas sp. T1lg65 TaxID=2077101 RepID=UPI003F7A4AF1
MQVIKRLYSTLFKPTQLLLRQNGKVSMLRLPAWLQAFAVLLILMAFGAIAWYISELHQANLSLQQRQSDLVTEQQAWQSEKHTLEITIQKQVEQLEQLSQQHSVLEAVVDSVELNESERATDTPQVEEQATTDEGKFAPQASSLEARQHKLVNFFNQQLETKNQQLADSLNATGIKIVSSNEAQGGPYNSADLSLVDETYLNTVDNLALYASLNSMVTLLPNTLPVEQEKYYVSSGFGYRKDPITGRRAYHKGIDLAGWRNTRILAPAAGTVTKAGRNGGYGNFIEIQHANGFITRYGHLSSIKVKKGQQVSKREVIALMGSTGRSTSTHLHYEVIQGKKHLNPIKIARTFGNE